MSSIVVLDHRFCSNTKTFKRLTNVDADAMDAVMFLNNNAQETGGIKKNVM